MHFFFFFLKNKQAEFFFFCLQLLYAQTHTHAERLLLDFVYYVDCGYLLSFIVDMRMHSVINQIGPGIYTVVVCCGLQDLSCLRQWRAYRLFFFPSFPLRTLKKNDDDENRMFDADITDA